MFGIVVEVSLYMVFCFNVIVRVRGFKRRRRGG